jgi:hypothetical protein
MDAELQLSSVREELGPIMAIAAFNISMLQYCRGYSVEVLAPALRRYHEANVALRQLGGRICVDNVSEAEVTRTCRPDVGASPIDPRPLDWAYYAFAEKSVITKSQIGDQLCSRRKLSSFNPSHQNPPEATDETTRTNLKKLEEIRTKSIANSLNTTTICVGTDWFGGIKLDPLIVLVELFAAWGAVQSHNASVLPLEGLGHVRIVLWGSDLSGVRVEHRSLTGQPIVSRGFIQERFNLTKSSSISAAWINFSEWQKMEHEFAVNERLTRPNAEWSTALDTWEAMGLDFSILAGNLFARHSKVFPLPLGVPNEFQDALALSRLNIRTHKISYKKKLLLLLNFKAFGGPFRPSSSERQAIYRLATLGDLTRNIQPWTFASVRPSNGKTHFKKKDMEYQYELVASSHFVLSPRGNGLDCFRTWEALSLGTIPIVKRSGPFDEIYKGLPVLLVGRWEDVTLELLERTLQEWRHRRFPNLKRISIAGWLHAGTHGMHPSCNSSGLVAGYNRDVNSSLRQLGSTEARQHKEARRPKRRLLSAFERASY